MFTEQLRLQLCKLELSCGQLQLEFVRCCGGGRHRGRCWFIVLCKSRIMFVDSSCRARASSRSCCTTSRDGGTRRGSGGSRGRPLEGASLLFDPLNTQSKE